MAKLYKINRDNLRDHNLSVVIQTLLNSTDPMSRADLAKSTGLTKAAMSMLVEILIKNKVIQQLENDETTFVVFGVAHIVGEEGIINQLQELGYTVESLS